MYLLSFAWGWKAREIQRIPECQVLYSGQCTTRIEPSQLIVSVNDLTGFIISWTLVLNWLIQRLFTHLGPILILHNPWNTRKHLDFFHSTYFHIKIFVRDDFFWGGGVSLSRLMIFLRGHPLSTYVKFSEKLTFLTPWYAHVPGLIRGLEMLVFRKILCMYFMDGP